MILRRSPLSSHPAVTVGNARHRSASNAFGKAYGGSMAYAWRTQVSNRRVNRHQQGADRVPSTDASSTCAAPALGFRIPHQLHRHITSGDPADSDPD